MSSFLASAAVFGLYLLLAVPALLAFVRPRLGWVAVLSYSVLAGLLVVHYVGFSVGPLPGLTEADLRSPVGGESAAPVEQCQQAVQMAERGGLILDRTRTQVAVRGGMWTQLPKPAQDTLVACLEASRPPGAAEQPLEIVER